MRKSDFIKNVAGFTILNKGTTNLTWQITNAADWITKIDPQKDTVRAGGAEAVSFVINRSKLSANASENYATLLVKSTTASDGSTAELLVTVFGSRNGINTTNDNSDLDYITIGDLYVQTKNLGGRIDWNSANGLCNNSVVGDYDDWRLPTIDELTTIYTKKEAIGGFNNDYPYWSSTYYSSISYWYLYFSDGKQGNYSMSGEYYPNTSSLYCRAVRRDMSPMVSILPTSNISESSVTFNGQIDNAGGPAYAERGFVYATSHFPTIGNTKVISYTPNSSVTFNETVTGLTIGVTYYVRAYATNSIITAYSEERVVFITNQKAQISTLPVTDITETSAVLHGSIDSKGIPAYTAKGFVYSTTFQNPTVEDNNKEDNNKKSIAGTDIGEFSANISELTTGTTYYVRAYATNSEGTAYGSSVSFTPESPNYVVLTATGIMVQKQDISESTLSWSSANSLCNNSTVGSYTDWRLPTKDELATMYNEKNVIGNFKSSAYWSSTQEVSYPSSHWYISFNTGNFSTTLNSFSFARAVRALP